MGPGMILWSKEIVISCELSDEEVISWRYFVYFLEYGIWWKEYGQKHNLQPPFRIDERLIKERMIAKMGP